MLCERRIRTGKFAYTMTERGAALWPLTRAHNDSRNRATLTAAPHTGTTSVRVVHHLRFFPLFNSSCVAPHKPHTSPDKSLRQRPPTSAEWTFSPLKAVAVAAAAVRYDSRDGAHVSQHHLGPREGRLPPGPLCRVQTGTSNVHFAHMWPSQQHAPIQSAGDMATGMACAPLRHA